MSVASSAKQTRRAVLLLLSSSSSSSVFFWSTPSSCSSPLNENCMFTSNSRVLQLRLTIFLLLGFRYVDFPRWCWSIDDKKKTRCLFDKIAGNIVRLCSILQRWRRRLILLLTSVAASADRTRPPSIWLHTSAANTIKKSLRNYFFATAKGFLSLF